VLPFIELAGQVKDAGGQICSLPGLICAPFSPFIMRRPAEAKKILLRQACPLLFFA